MKPAALLLLLLGNLNSAEAQLSTASEQVHILDSSFPIKTLGRERRIWIYLPPDYKDSNTKYPVLYLHDGQNLFDDATSFAGEWCVDETLDRLKLPMIVVGIDNGGQHRMTEYNPEDNNRFGKAEGRDYLEFLVKELKPYVDRHYRTRKQARYTSIAGASMGGLISYYAGIWYPKTFGKIGVFSPSFWIVSKVKELTATTVSTRQHARQHYYFYCGAKESDKMVPDMEAVIQVLTPLLPEGAVTTRINPIGEHKELFWRTELPQFLKAK